MSVLNSWQRISRVLPAFPFGDGADGALNISSSTSLSVSNISCSGSSDQADLTIASGAFSNGNVVLIHQTRGTGVSQWEINRVSSGGGTTTLTMQEDLHYTYTDSGSSQAQVITLPRYTNVLIQSGKTLSAPASWAGNTGGMIVFAAKTLTTISGNVKVNGAAASGNTGASGGGFRGGTGTSSTPGGAAEGTVGAAVNQLTANGNGGSGKARAGGPDYGLSGAGGGNAAAGSGSAPGAAAGSADLIGMVFGGGGGSGASDDVGAGRGGGSGGGIVVIFTKEISVGGTIQVDGGKGATELEGSPTASNRAPGGGGGAGGSVLIATNNGSIGTDIISAVAGAGGDGTGEFPSPGAAGSVGRIAIHHSGTVSGTTSPSYEDVEDITLRENRGFMAFL